MPFLFLGKLVSLFQMSQASGSLPSSLQPQRKPISDWCRSTLFEVEQITACSRFFLSKIWHWERDGGFRHEGLTFEFIRHDRATVCIKVDRLSYDNDPYTSTVKAFNLSGADILAESRIKTARPVSSKRKTGCRSSLATNAPRFSIPHRQVSPSPLYEEFGNDYFLECRTI
ncbi:hypothetical protein BS47DRAFT_365815 [Hydnum rufescens UP504]|uniref:Uncharacterized protein n=1 Tax=Hydnum rufescens UP504 TaxID=1448309 RepID=A0A9P6AJK2_9AGAM|nr:hypothetical protein BS47DRAFT_365815 [Hydnum rufescens UP504]